MSLTIPGERFRIWQIAKALGTRSDIVYMSAQRLYLDLRSSASPIESTLAATLATYIMGERVELVSTRFRSLPDCPGLIALFPEGDHLNNVGRRCSLAGDLGDRQWIVSAMVQRLHPPQSGSVYRVAHLATGRTQIVHLQGMGNLA